MKEIERKFLISSKTFKNLSKNKNTEYIEQGYLILKPSFHTRVRIYKSDKKTWAEITSKTGKGIERGEFNTDLDLIHAKILMKEALRVLKKIRVKVIYKEFTWDVDYFPDHKIAVAEIELTHKKQSFPLPPWALKEITGVKKYSNIALARKKR